MKAEFISAAVNLDLVDVPFDRNVREHTVEAFDDPAMRDSFALMGQQTTVKLLKVGERYEPIQGFRRVYNLKKAREMGMLDPKTAKRDAKGDIMRDEDGKPIGAKVFSTVQAEVYEGISEARRIELLIDHGNIRPLNKVELFLAIMALLTVGEKERVIVTRLFNLLRQHYPPSRQIVDPEKDKGVDALEHYRGVVQTARNAWESPTVVCEAWERKLKNGLAWPVKGEVAQALKIYKEERDSDRTGRISRKTPGPKFTAFWNMVVEKHTAANAEGKRAAKSAAMMNHSQIQSKPLDSRILKAYRAIILRHIPEDQLPLLDGACAKYEVGELTSAQIQTVLDQIFEKQEVATEATATQEPAKAETAAS